MVFFPPYALIAPLLNFSVACEGLVPRLRGDWVFYFTLLLLRVICLSRDFAWKYDEHTFQNRTTSLRSFESTSSPITDPAARREQFQKATKKIRTVQRMRRNRGIAESLSAKPRLLCRSTGSGSSCPGLRCFEIARAAIWLLIDSA